LGQYRRKLGEVGHGGEGPLALVLACRAQPTSMMSSMLRGSGPSMTRNRIWKDVFSQLITASLRSF
jgi:hypothetical protein